MLLYLVRKWASEKCGMWSEKGRVATVAVSGPKKGEWEVLLYVVRKRGEWQMLLCLFRKKGREANLAICGWQMLL